MLVNDSPTQVIRAVTGDLSGGAAFHALMWNAKRRK